MFYDYRYWLSVNSTEIQFKGIFLSYHLQTNIESYEIGAAQSIGSPVLRYGFFMYVSLRGHSSYTSGDNKARSSQNTNTFRTTLYRKLETKNSGRIHLLNL